MKDLACTDVFARVNQYPEDLVLCVFRWRIGGIVSLVVLDNSRYLTADLGFIHRSYAPNASAHGYL